MSKPFPNVFKWVRSIANPTWFGLWNPRTRTIVRVVNSKEGRLNRPWAKRRDAMRSRLVRRAYC